MSGTEGTGAPAKWALFGLSITVAAQLGGTAYFFGDQARLLSETASRLSTIDIRGTEPLRAVAERQNDALRRLSVLENNYGAQQAVLNAIDRKLAVIEQKLDGLVKTGGR